EQAAQEVFGTDSPAPQARRGGAAGTAWGQRLQGWGGVGLGAVLGMAAAALVAGAAWWWGQRQAPSPAPEAAPLISPSAAAPAAPALPGPASVAADTVDAAPPSGAAPATPPAQPTPASTSARVE